MGEATDIVDAQFETVGHAARPAPAPWRPAPDAAPARGLGLFRRSRGRTDKGRDPMPLPVFATIAALSAGLAFCAAGGHVLFGTPGTAGPATAPATPIVLDRVATRVDTSGGRAVLVVHAGLVNRGAAPARVPPVAITFDRPDGSGSVTHTLARGERLAPGERMVFTSRIPASDHAGVAPHIALAPAR